MPCTPAQLAKAKKWRDNNREKCQDVCRISHKKTYNYLKESERHKIYNMYKKECIRLRGILFD